MLHKMQTQVMCKQQGHKQTRICYLQAAAEKEGQKKIQVNSWLKMVENDEAAMKIQVSESSDWLSCLSDCKIDSQQTARCISL